MERRPLLSRVPQETDPNVESSRDSMYAYICGGENRVGTLNIDPQIARSPYNEDPNKVPLFSDTPIYKCTCICIYIYLYISLYKYILY